MACEIRYNPEISNKSLHKTDNNPITDITKRRILHAPRKQKIPQLTRTPTVATELANTILASSAANDSIRDIPPPANDPSQMVENIRKMTKEQNPDRYSYIQSICKSKVSGDWDAEVRAAFQDLNKIMNPDTTSEKSSSSTTFETAETVSPDSSAEAEELAQILNGNMPFRGIPLKSTCFGLSALDCEEEYASMQPTRVRHSTPLTTHIDEIQSKPRIFEFEAQSLCELPTEIWNKIFQFLPDSKSMFYLGRTCKYLWQVHITEIEKKVVKLFQKNDYKVQNFDELKQRDIAYLANNDLQKFPSELLLLKDSITYLNLNHNNLSALPAELKNFTKLKSLDLQGNQFKEVPPILYEMTHLKSVDLTKNPITSVSFPREMVFQLDSTVSRPRSPRLDSNVREVRRVVRGVRRPQI